MTYHSYVVLFSPCTPFCVFLCFACLSSPAPQFILYLNWKTELDLGEERNMMEVIPEELEIYNFPKRDVIVVDTFNSLLETLLSMPLDMQD